MAYTGQDLSDLTFTQLSFDDGTTPVIVEETENNSDDTQDTVQDQQIAFSIVGSGNSTGSLAVIPAHTLGGSRIAKKRFEEAGIPLLILDGDGCDRSHGGEGQTSTRLGAFLEMLGDFDHE